MDESCLNFSKRVVHTSDVMQTSHVVYQVGHVTYELGHVTYELVRE